MAIGELGKVLRHIQVAFDVGTANGLTDRQLVEQFAARSDSASELAFGALVQRHGPMVLRVCRRILRNHQDAEDAFQATFLILARKASSLWVRDSMGPWLHGVAFRVAASSKMAAARRRRHERGAAAISASDSADRDDDIDGLKTLLHEELGRLPERFRTPIVLCDLEGQTYETVARQLGWPVGTVKSRLARGRERLRDRILRRGADAAPAVLIRALSEENACLSISSTMIDATAQLAMGLNAGSPAIKVLPGATVGLMEGVLKMMFWSKIKAAVASLAMGCGLLSVSVLCFGPGSRADGPLTAQVGVERGSKETAPNSAPMPRSTPPTEEPGMLPPEPKPWETAVRIRVIAEKSTGMGSGTIIYSSSDESIVLTAAHHFAVRHDGSLMTGSQPVAAENGKNSAEAMSLREPFPLEPYYGELITTSLKINIDLLDGKRLNGRLTAESAQNDSVETFAGELIDCDFPRDVALVRIRPYRRLAASRVVPRRWKPKTGARLLAVGNSAGRQPMTWLTTITNPSYRVFRERQLGEWIECEVAPERGRAGGGLFTSDGFLAGVCNYGEPADNRGLYAAPGSIYFLLDRNKLASAYEKSEHLEKIMPDRAAGHDRAQPLLNSTLIPGSIQRTDETGMLPSQPKPWETVVRMKVHGPANSVGFGSGTVIQSTSEESIILTAAHYFQLDGSRTLPPSKSPFRIEIDLFDGKMTGSKPAQVHFLETVAGELVDRDVDHDVALVRIKPGRELAASRVVPRRWNAEAGMQVLTVGCSEGHDATAWHTTITSTSQHLSGRPGCEWIECKVAPKQGRTGGGLFTSDGFVAGVCNYAQPADDRGLYAAPGSIYLLLDRNGLTSVYEDAELDETKLDENIRALEEQIQRETWKLKWWKAQRETAAAERRSRGSRSSTPSPPVVTYGPVVPVGEPAKPPSELPDHEHRLRDVEQKLDRVLELLEKREKPER